MENYDKIAQDLKQTIDEYRKSLASLEDRFADMKSIINDLDQLKPQIDLADKRSNELLTAISVIENKYAALVIQSATLNDEYASTQALLKANCLDWNREVSQLGSEMADALSRLKAEFHDKLNNALVELQSISNEEIASFDQYMRELSDVYKAESLGLKKYIASIEAIITQLIKDNNSKILSATKTTRVIIVVGFAILALLLLSAILI